MQWQQHTQFNKINNSIFFDSLGSMREYLFDRCGRARLPYNNADDCHVSGHPCRAARTESFHCGEFGKVILSIAKQIENRNDGK